MKVMPNTGVAFRKGVFQRRTGAFPSHHSGSAGLLQIAGVPLEVECHFSTRVALLAIRRSFNGKPIHGRQAINDFSAAASPSYSPRPPPWRARSGIDPPYKQTSESRSGATMEIGSKYNLVQGTDRAGPSCQPGAYESDRVRRERP